MGNRAWDSVLRRSCAALVVLLILGLGGIENWYGRTDSGDLFGTDAVQYLDCARAMDRGDLRAALNPLWSQGYPALLAVARPIFPGDMAGDWLTMRAVNMGVLCFCMASFAYLLASLSKKRDASLWLCGAGVFVATELCLGHVSRVGPDELVTGFFFLACALLLRLMRHGTALRSLGFGLALGLGFLAKSVFLPLGCMMYVVLAVVVWRSGRKLLVLAPSGAVFAAIVLGYGALLSHAAGYRTLGESGALNYAWRVNRLAKWVHWEGGRESADKAWPQPWMARFTRWDDDPPDFGKPIHPTRMTGKEPTVYLFDEPVKATYIPYYDPAYFYQGYRHFFRWRYQVIAVGRGSLQLGQILLTQPMFYGILTAMWLLRKRRQQGLWPVAVCGALGIALYLPVEVQDRYINGFLAVLAVTALAGVLESEGRRRRMVVAIVLLAASAEIVKEQRVEWSRVIHGWDYRDNMEWKVAQAVERGGLRPGSAVGMISWTPNLHSNWAYLAHVRITGEIAGPKDEDAFWAMSDAERREVLRRFRTTGEEAVLSWEEPPQGAGAGWQRLANTSMWMYRF